MQNNISKTAQFLNDVCSNIKYKEIHNDIKEELASHIADIEQHFIRDGKSDKEAESLAISQMGSSAEIGLRLNKVHCPKTEWSVLILAAVLFLFGIITSNDIYTQFSPLLGYKNIIENVFFVVTGLAAFLIIYFFDLKSIIKYCLPVFVASSIVLIIIIVSFGRNINTFNSHLRFMTTLIAVNMVSFSGSICNYRKNYKAILLHFIPALLTVFSLFKFNGFIWAILLALVFSTLTILIIKGNSAKSRIKLVIYIVCLFLLSGIALAFIFMMYLAVSIRAIPLPAILSGLQKIKFIGHADSITFGFISRGFSLMTTLVNYGALFTLVVFAALIVFVVRLFISSKSIKDTFFKNTSISICLVFVFEVIVGLINESGIYLTGESYAYSIFPFLSHDIPNYMLNMILLAALLSCFRRKNITPHN